MGEDCFELPTKMAWKSVIGGRRRWNERGCTPGERALPLHESGATVLPLHVQQHDGTEATVEATAAEHLTIEVGGTAPHHAQWWRWRPQRPFHDTSRDGRGRICSPPQLNAAPTEVGPGWAQGKQRRHLLYPSATSNGEGNVVAGPAAGEGKKVAVFSLVDVKEVGGQGNKRTTRQDFRQLLTSKSALRHLRLFAVLCVGLLATHLFAVAYAKSVESEEMGTYRADVAFLQTTVFNQLKSSHSEMEIISKALWIMLGATGSSAGGNLTAAQFSALTAPATSEGRSIVYLPRVPAEARPEFEAAASALYGQDIYVTEASRAGFVPRANLSEGEYWPVMYAEPRNDAFVGFDTFADSTRRPAIERLIVTGESTYSTPFAARDTGEMIFSLLLPVKGGPSLVSSSSSSSAAAVHGSGSGGVGGDASMGAVAVFIRVEPVLEQSSLQKFQATYPGTQVDIGFLASDRESRTTIHGVPFSGPGVGSETTIFGFEQTLDPETSFYVQTPSVPRHLEKRGLPQEYYVVLAGGCVLLGLLCYWERRNFMLQAARKQEAAAAREASSAKSCFLRSITHEIRTPMNGIVGMAQLLEGVDLPDSVLPYLDVIHSCSTTLLSLVNNILDMSKIEAGKIEIGKRSFRLDTLAVEMVESAWTILHTSGTSSLSSMSLTVGGEVPRERVVGDDVRIRQLFNNLLSNATKFTKHGSIDVFLDAVRMSSSKESEEEEEAEDGEEEVMILLTARDSGIGMAPDAVEGLFKPFVQVHDSATTTNVQGTGLGLAISGALAQAMGGDMACTSVLGEGSEFCCTFSVVGKLREPASAGPGPEASSVGGAVPADNAHQNENEAATVDYRRVYTRDHGLRVEGDAILPSSTQGTAKIGSAKSVSSREGEGITTRGRLSSATDSDDSPPRPPSVLVVDDNKTNRMVLSKLLGSLGLVVECAGTGLQAVETCSQQRFSIILLDKVMPVMDGIDAARELRAGDGPCKYTPIIFITADCSTEAIRECTEAGGNDFSNKPVRREAIVEKMAHLLPPPERSWLLDKEREFCKLRKQATYVQSMARGTAEAKPTRPGEEKAAVG